MPYKDKGAARAYQQAYYRKHREAKMAYRKQKYKENQEYNREYRKKNKEKILESNRRWRKKHREKVMEYNKKFYQGHKEQLRRYREERKEHYCELKRASYRRHADARNQRRRERRKDDLPRHLAMERAARQRRRDRECLYAEDYASHRKWDRVWYAKKRFRSGKYYKPNTCLRIPDFFRRGEARVSDAWIPETCRKADRGELGMILNSPNLRNKSVVRSWRR